ncbi:MAG: molybdopterin-binding protein, partial [Candidatus Dormibacteraceae bacterium]
MGTSIIAIGDELLSGFTLDTNSHWMSEQLRRLGFQVKRRSTVRDRNQDVAEQVLRDLRDPE